MKVEECLTLTPVNNKIYSTLVGGRLYIELINQVGSGESFVY